MHSAGYSTQSPIALFGVALGLLWAAAVLYMAESKFELSYFGFHCVFTLLFVGILASRLWQRMLAERTADMIQTRIAAVHRTLLEVQVLTYPIYLLCWYISTLNLLAY
jgi:hypothetical protein